MQILSALNLALIALADSAQADSVDLKATIFKGNSAVMPHGLRSGSWGGDRFCNFPCWASSRETWLWLQGATVGAPIQMSDSEAGNAILPSVVRVSSFDRCRSLSALNLARQMLLALADSALGPDSSRFGRQLSFWGRAHNSNALRFAKSMSSWGGDRFYISLLGKFRGLGCVMRGSGWRSIQCPDSKRGGNSSPVCHVKFTCLIGQSLSLLPVCG